MNDYTAAVQAFLAVNLDHTPRPVPSAARRLAPGEVEPLRHGALELPCQRNDPSLWFAEAPRELERAKALCAQCPIRLACLSVAVDRGEFAGVWGGHIFDRGRIVAYKRGRGRPRKHRSVCAGTRTGATEEHLMSDTTPTAIEQGSAAARTAAARLYDAECALHTAHQSHVDAWIDAANRRLHDAVSEYITVATAPQLEKPLPAGPAANRIAAACP